MHFWTNGIFEKVVFPVIPGENRIFSKKWVGIFEKGHFSQ
jgi:hypothetical protein